MSEKTLELHHGAHHNTYVNNLNDLVKKNNADGKGIYELMDSDVQGIKNNSGGHYNHSLFWHIMAAPSMCKEEDLVGTELMGYIKKDFGGIEELKNAVKNAALGVFGSGWVWLSFDSNTDRVVVTKSANQDNPMSGNSGMIPFFCLDVWEHAYYVDYENRRPEYIDQWWAIVNWKIIAEDFSKYASKGIPVPAIELLSLSQ